MNLLTCVCVCVRALSQGRGLIIVVPVLKYDMHNCLSYCVSAVQNSSVRLWLFILVFCVQRVGLVVVKLEYYLELC